MPPTGDVSVGAVVEVSAGRGRVRFSGTTSFAPGKWVGVELSDRNGKNDGSVAGVSYFNCEMGYGVFVRASQVKVLEEAPAPTPRMTTRPTSRANAQSSVPQRPTHAARGSISSISIPGRAAALPPISRAPSTHAISRTPSSQSISSRPASSVVPQSIPKPQRTLSNTSLLSRTNSPSKGPAAARIVQSTPSIPTSRLGPSLNHKRPGIPPISRSSSSSVSSVATPSHVTQIVEDTLFNVSLPPELSEEETVQSPVALPRANASPVLRRIQESPVTRRLSQPPSASSPISPSVSTAAPTASNREVEELKVKLRHLEAKRGDDAIRIRELENRIAETEQFVALRPKLQAKLTSQQSELHELRRTVKDTSLEKETLEAKLVEISEQLEMAMLDKEMAETKGEMAEAEVERLKDALADAEVEIELHKEEKAVYESEPAPTGDKSSLAYVQLEKHNERLKEALIRLRDLAQESEIEHRKKVTELERDLAAVEDLQSQYDMARSRLENADAQIEDLKLQLDDALGAEEILVQLTERNLLMGEKIEDMRIVIEDLEALRELNDELEETHVETEKQLQEEIELKSAQLREQIRRGDALEDNIADYENTIQQFREVVATLQADLEHLREQQMVQQTESQSLNTQSQAMMSLNMKLQTSVVKSQAKNIDLELRKLDAIQAKEHLSIVQLFLPQAYFESDSRATACYLFFARLAYKAELINSVIAQKYNLPESLNGAVSDSLIGVCEMRGRVGHLSALCKRFVAVLRRCDPETFVKAGSIYADVAPMERRMDLHIDLLRRDEFREVECVSDVHKMLAQFEHLSDTFFAGFQVDLGERELDLALSLDFDLDIFMATLGLVQQVLDSAMKDEEVDVEFGDLDLEIVILEPLQRLVNQSKSTKAIARKLVGRMEDLIRDTAVLRPHLVPAFGSLNGLVSKAVDFSIQLAQAVSQYMAEIRASKEPFSLQHVVLSIRTIAADTMGKRDVSWEAVGEILAQLSAEAASLVPIILEVDNVLKITGNAPWLARVEDIKAKTAVNIEAERELAILKEKTQELQRFIKAKDQSIQEATVKIELMDRRMESVKKQTEAITDLENELTKARKQERAYEDAIEQLQSELEAAEENTKLKAGGTVVDKGNGSAGETEHAAEGTLETSYLLEQIESLRGALRFLRSENSYLKGQDLLRELHSLPSLDVPGIRESDHATLTPALSPSPDSDSDSESDRPGTPPSIRTLAEATKHLYSDVLMHAASTRVVDVSNISGHNSRRWRRKRETPEWQLTERRRETEALGRRVKGLAQTIGAVVALR